MVIAILALIAWVQHIAAPPFGDLAWYANALPALLGDKPLYDPATLQPHPMVAPEYWNQAPSLAPFVLTLVVTPYIWIVACIGSMAAGFVLIWPRVGAAATLTGVALLLLWEPVRAALWSANVNAMVFGLLAVALRFPRVAGWSIGLAAALKLIPILGVAWLIGKRDWRGAAVAVGVLAAFTSITVIAEGPAVLRDFVVQRLNEYDPHMEGQISLHAFGFSPWVGYAAAAVLSVLAARFASFSLAVMAMLVSVPNPHNHYWTWLLVPLLGIWVPWLMDRVRLPSVLAPERSAAG
jgi:Glycosyltransferase family 87